MTGQQVYDAQRIVSAYIGRKERITEQLIQRYTRIPLKSLFQNGLLFIFHIYMIIFPYTFLFLNHIMLCKVLTTSINVRLIDVVKQKTFMPLITTDSKCTTPIKEVKIKISLPKNVVKYLKLFISIYFHHRTQEQLTMQKEEQMFYGNLQKHFRYDFFSD